MATELDFVGALRAGWPQPVRCPEADVAAARASAAARFRPRFVILAPPRTASTALARVLWEDPAVTHYAHEPFDRLYHRGEGPQTLADALADPTQVSRHTATDSGAGRGLVLKEMTFQVGRLIEPLAAFTDAPLIFLIRDPRRSVMSRMRQVGDGTPVSFPLVETGWVDLMDQIAYCDRTGREFVLLDAGELREWPRVVLPQLFERLGLTWRPSVLDWTPAARMRLGRLDGDQDHWYQAVLNSRSIGREHGVPPPLDQFPKADGMRAHVAQALEWYRALRRRPERVQGGGE
jgi:hypothetical protein